MSSKVNYHRYDLLLPAIIDGAKRIFQDPANRYSEMVRERQVAKLELLKEVVLDEFGLDPQAASLPLRVITPESVNYPHWLALRLSVEPPVKVRFILDHHLEQYHQDSDESRNQFLKLVEFRLMDYVHHWNTPDTDQRTRYMADWLRDQRQEAVIAPKPGTVKDRLHYWPHPPAKLERLYEYLLDHALIAENPYFMDSFRDYNVNPKHATPWLGEKKILVGLFFKLNRFRRDYKAEPIHLVVMKLFRDKSAEPLKQESMSQTLRTYTYDFENGTKLNAQTSALFDFVDRLELFV